MSSLDVGVVDVLKDAVISKFPASPLSSLDAVNEIGGGGIVSDVLSACTCMKKTFIQSCTRTHTHTHTHTYTHTRTHTNTQHKCVIRYNLHCQISQNTVYSPHHIEILSVGNIVCTV